MVFCKVCDTDVEAFQEEPSGYTVCTSCGHVLDHSAWSSEPTFTKEGGESTVAGHFVSNVAGTHGLGRISGGRIYGFQYDATEKAGSKGKHEIERLVDLLGIRPREDVVSSAHRLYMLAVQHNFNRGRRTAHIAAAAIYIICRQEGHPFMLLDFSDVLQVNVFVLGAIFLQLCKILRLEEHAIMTRPTDPSLFLHRFAARMGFGDKMHQVANTALRLVSSMKRDWLQTGRRPAGVCGAALYIAGHIHGFSITREDVIRIVHIGESTLEKRVSEFAGTNASALTAIEFEEHSKEVERNEQLRLETIESVAALAGPSAGGPSEHGCEHLAQGTAVFAHGMCRECYMTFLTVSGGMDTAGANPPAFTAGQMKADALLAIEGGDDEQPRCLPEYPGQGAESDGLDTGIEAEMTSALHDNGLHSIAQAVVPSSDMPEAPTRVTRAAQKRKQAEATANEVSKSPRKRGKKSDAQKSLPGSTEKEPTQANSSLPATSPPANTCMDIVPAEEQPSPPANEAAAAFEDPPEELSDLSEDDDGYFHSAAEVKLKGIVWTAMNQDYIEKQALKAAAESKKQEKQAALMIEGAGSQKPKGRSRAKSKAQKEAENNLGPADTAADGVKKMLDAKKLSNKVNYANLDVLFDDSAPLMSEPTSPKASGKPPRAPPKSKSGPAARTKPVKSKLLTEDPTDLEKTAHKGGQSSKTKPKTAVRSSGLGSLKSTGLGKRKMPTASDSIF